MTDKEKAINEDVAKFAAMSDEMQMPIERSDYAIKILREILGDEKPTVKLSDVLAASVVAASLIWGDKNGVRQNISDALDKLAELIEDHYRKKK